MNTLRPQPPGFEREVDEGYLASVREMPCAVFGCWEAAEPHHICSRGAGGSDYSVIPLCRRHHTDIHRMGVSTFQSIYDVDVWAEAANALASHVRTLKEGENNP